MWTMREWSPYTGKATFCEGVPGAQGAPVQCGCMGMHALQGALHSRPHILSPLSTPGLNTTPMHNAHGILPRPSTGNRPLLADTHAQGQPVP